MHHQKPFQSQTSESNRREGATPPDTTCPPNRAANPENRRQNSGRGRGGLRHNGRGQRLVQNTSTQPQANNNKSGRPVAHHPQHNNIRGVGRGTISNNIANQPQRQNQSHHFRGRGQGRGQRRPRQPHSGTQRHQHASIQQSEASFRAQSPQDFEAGNSAKHTPYWPNIQKSDHATQSIGFNTNLFGVATPQIGQRSSWANPTFGPQNGTEGTTDAPSGNIQSAQEESKEGKQKTVWPYYVAQEIIQKPASANSNSADQGQSNQNASDVPAFLQRDSSNLDASVSIDNVSVKPLDALRSMVSPRLTFQRSFVNDQNPSDSTPKVGGGAPAPALPKTSNSFIGHPPTSMVLGCLNDYYKMSGLASKSASSLSYQALAPPVQQHQATTATAEGRNVQETNQAVRPGRLVRAVSEDFFCQLVEDNNEHQSRRSQPPSTPRDRRPSLDGGIPKINNQILLNNSAILDEPQKAKSVQENNNANTFEGANDRNDFDSLESAMAWETHREPSDELDDQRNNNELSLASAEPLINQGQSKNTHIMPAIYDALAADRKPESPPNVNNLTVDLSSVNNFDWRYGRKSTDQKEVDDIHKLYTPQPHKFQDRKRVEKFTRKFDHLNAFSLKNEDQTNLPKSSTEGQELQQAIFSQKVEKEAVLQPQSMQVPDQTNLPKNAKAIFSSSSNMIQVGTDPFAGQKRKWNQTDQKIEDSTQNLNQVNQTNNRSD